MTSWFDEIEDARPGFAGVQMFVSMSKRVELRMRRKKSDYIEKAAEQVQEMVAWRTKGADKHEAMADLARSRDIPHGTIWALHYRKPKSIGWDLVEWIKEVYAAECRRQAQIAVEKLERIAGENHEAAQTLVHQFGAVLRREGACPPDAANSNRVGDPGRTA